NRRITGKGKDFFMTGYFVRFLLRLFYKSSGSFENPLDIRYLCGSQNRCTMQKKSAQITDTILMVRPVDYRLNEQTAVNNYFQREMNLSPEEVTKKAQDEFDAFVDKLRKVGVKVIVVDDIKENKTPDSIFPNNWVSFHQNGDIA